MGEVATIEPRVEPRPNLVAGGKVAAIVPTSMDEAYRLAKAVCIAGMAPKGMETPEKCMIAIMHGMEIGLTPMTALQRIAVVNGRPTIWGDGAMSLVRGSGACEYVRETMEGAGEARVAVCETKRRGEREPTRRTFSVADAKKAGLWGKSGPWQQFPDRMLQMRARAFCLRDGFADVLGGLYLKEELDNGPMIDGNAAPAQPVPQAIAPARKGPPGPPPPPAPAIAPPPPKAASEPPALDWEAFRADIRKTASVDESNAVFDAWTSKHEAQMTPEDWDEAQALLNKHAEGFEVE